MPDVVGKRLDIAVSDIERAGVDDEVEVLGGGMFGVVDESNWTVCSQEPDAGEEMTSAPRISVDRSCDGGDKLDKGSKEPRDLSGGPAREQSSDKPGRRQDRPRGGDGVAQSETFTMPLLVGMNLQRAQNVLQDRGSYLLTQTDATGKERFQMFDYNWKVCGQVPAPGTETDVATMVEIVTAKLSESC